MRIRKILKDTNVKEKFLTRRILKDTHVKEKSLMTAKE